LPVAALAQEAENSSKTAVDPAETAAEAVVGDAAEAVKDPDAAATATKATSSVTNDGGKVTSLTVYVPQSIGLTKSQSYIPALVQGEFVSNFSNYSTISILDWERLDDIYVKLINEAYDDKAAAKQDVMLGRLAPTSHFLTGNITKTAKGYNIKMNITATADKMTVATYSGTFSFAELDNLTGIRRASLDLLQKVGVELTDKARQELAGAATANQISAQTALAMGVIAQRQGTEIEALTYFFQATALDASLVEASKRSSVVAANISSGNIGADVRNEILWRKKWIAKLKETEETFYKLINNADIPYMFYYSTDIVRGKIDYQNETTDLRTKIGWTANQTWFATLERSLQAAQAVLDGLNATNRKKDWGLADWPRQGISNTNPFISQYSSSKSKNYDFTITFELVNARGQIIGNKTIRTGPDFSLILDQKGRFNLKFYTSHMNIIEFSSVRANDISDKLTIRIASINGVSPKNTRFAIATIASSGIAQQPLIDTRDGKKYNTVKIGHLTWMAENMNYETDKSKCHRDNENNCDTYGRLYDWYTAMNVCPSGWRLPDYSDWNAMNAMIDGWGRNMLGGVVIVSNSGTKLKSTIGWTSDDKGKLIPGTDSFGFSALPGGGDCFDRSYFKTGQYGYWWTATEENSSVARAMVMRSNDEDTKYSSEEKSYGFSVRCVQK